jgi:hypothetical protein
MFRIETPPSDPCVLIEGARLGDARDPEGSRSWIDPATTRVTPWQARVVAAMQPTKLR